MAVKLIFTAKSTAQEESKVIFSASSEASIRGDALRYTPQEVGMLENLVHCAEKPVERLYKQALADIHYDAACRRCKSLPWLYQLDHKSLIVLVYLCRCGERLTINVGDAVALVRESQGQPARHVLTRVRNARFRANWTPSASVTDPRVLHQYVKTVDSSQLVYAAPRSL